MTKREQIRFLRELTTNILEPMIDNVRQGLVPADWDGHELRLWLKTNFAMAAFIPMGRKRKQDFDTVRSVNNLR